MADNLATTLADLADHLANLARQDDRLRERLRALVLAVLEHADLPAIAAVTELSSTPDSTPTEPSSAVEIPTEPPATIVDPAPSPLAALANAEPRLELLLGKPRLPPLPPRSGTASGTSPTSTPAPHVDDEWNGIEVRCRLKAEGLRWAVERRRIEADRGDFRVEIAPRDHDLLDRARALHCQLWMNRPEYVVPTDPATVENAARWFEALARAVDLAREAKVDTSIGRPHLEPILRLLAEAQSALRMTVLQAGGPTDDDQKQMYDWIRSATRRERIYLDRHMRLDDPANTADPDRFEARVADLASRLRKGRHQAQQSGKLFQLFRHHARQIAKYGGADRAHDWRRMADAVDGLIADGHPPSAIELRELLLPILDQIPDDLGEVSPAFGRVLREVDAYLETRPEPPDSNATAEEPTGAVSQAAALLKGTVMVLIGGQCRPHARDALKAALKLKELDWISSREHTSIERFEANVTRPDVSLVALAIRWSSHSYSDVKQFCDDHGKPMVRLPGGYGINQVATQILDQCSGQLEVR